MKRRHTVFLILLLATSSFSLAQRAIPDDNLAYPVLINLSDCNSNIASARGSGFYLSTGSELYLVTARHVLFNEAERVQPLQARPLLCKKAELVSYSKDPKYRQQNRIELDLQALNVAGEAKAHATKDVAVVHIGTVHKVGEAAEKSKQEYELNLFAGARKTAMAPGGLLTVDITTIEKFEEVLTANDVYVIGYPSSIGIQQTPQIDYSAPLLRKGIVAGVNESNKTIVLDCLTFFGNSGGPVLQAVDLGLGGRRFDVIGVISQYVPFTEVWVNTTLSYGNMQLHNSGYSIAEPMDSVLELIGK